MMVDLNAVLNRATLDVWGMRVSYHPRASRPGMPPFPVTAAWTHEPVNVLSEIAASEMQAAGHSTVHPVLGVRRSDLGFDAAPGDRFTVEGKTYEVWDVQPDTSGWQDLIARALI